MYAILLNQLKFSACRRSRSRLNRIKIPRWSLDAHLHVSRDRLALAQYLMKRSRSHGVSQGGLGQESRAVMRVLHVRNRDGRVVHTVVNHRVDRHGDAVFRQDLAEHRELEKRLFRYPSVDRRFAHELAIPVNVHCSRREVREN